jgi:SPX domain protein involved in polyphosphate accumulation
VNSTKKSSQEAPNWVTKHQEKHLVEHVKKIS